MRDGWFESSRPNQVSFCVRTRFPPSGFFVNLFALVDDFVISLSVVTQSLTDKQSERVQLPPSKRGAGLWSGFGPLSPEILVQSKECQFESGCQQPDLRGAFRGTLDLKTGKEYHLKSHDMESATYILLKGSNLRLTGYGDHNSQTEI